MSLLGRTLGHIRVVDVLGSGGMGEVYVGFDEKLKRKVALKAIQRSASGDPDARARFLLEARVLSQLDHPNICRIYDFVEEGEADYLVLELVEGTSLRDLLRRGKQPTHAVMRQAQQIAAVLEAAHEKGIVHRDLKPANVMVTPAGDVKVLDFGLARLTDQDELPTMAMLPMAAVDTAKTTADVPPPSSLTGPRTTRGSLLGTLQYMSPEQARGEPVSFPSDVFSLALVLQELFSDQPGYPSDLTAEQLLARARTGETQPVKGADRDLATLIERMKAVAPAARPTAREVVERLHHIAGKRARWLRRLAAVLAVVAAVGGTAKYTFDLRRERARSETARAEAEKVVKLLVDVFAVADPEKARGESITAREVLDRGAERIGVELRDQPRVHARLADIIADVYEGLGLLDRAEAQAREVLRIRSELDGEDSQAAAEAALQLGDLLRKQGHYQEAEPLLLRSLALSEQHLGPQDLKLTRCLNILAVLYENWGRLKEAEPLYRRALEIYEAHPEADPLDRVGILTNLAILFAKQGKDTAAEPLFRQALALEERQLGGDHPRVAISLMNLAIILKRQGRFDEAEPLYRQALAIQERTLPPEHPSLGNTVMGLANLKLDSGHYAEAEPLYERALAIYEAAYHGDHPNLALGLSNMAICRQELGDYAGAEELFRRALAMQERVTGPESLDVGNSLRNLATLLVLTHQPQQAEAAARRSLEILEKVHGASSSQLAPSLHNLGAALNQQGRRAEAEPILRRALALAESATPPNPEQLEGIRKELAK